MDGQIKISDFHKVFDGDLKPGNIDNTKRGRMCDGLVYFTEGETSYAFGTHSFIAHAGDVVFLPKNSLYKMHICKKSHFICVDFSFEDSPDTRKGAHFPCTPPSLLSDFEKLFYTSHRKEAWRLYECMSLLYKIISACVKSLHKRYEKSSEIASLALKFILENYTNPCVTVPDISAHLDISEPHLRRIFKSKTGISPIKYITLLRIEKAKNMLKNSNCTVCEISSLCGFCDAYYFSREFKKEVGVSPTEYRKN